MLVSDGDKLLAPCACPTCFLRCRNSGTSSGTHRSVSSCCRCAVQSTQCPNRGIQCVYLLCQLVPLCLQQRDYLHVFASGEDCSRYSRNYAALCINVNSTRNASSSSLRSSAVRVCPFCTRCL